MINDTEMVQYFLKLGCDPNYITSNNYTSFYYSVSHCNIKMCKLLLNMKNEYPKHAHSLN